MIRDYEIRKRDAARLLAAGGYTHASIAELVGVTRETISRWNTSDPLVTGLVAQHQNHPYAAEPGAVAVLRGLLRSEDERIRLQASIALLNLKVERVPETDPEPEPDHAAPEGYAIVRTSPIPGSKAAQA